MTAAASLVGGHESGKGGEGKGQLHSFGQRILDGARRGDAMPFYEDPGKHQMHFSHKCILDIYICSYINFYKFFDIFNNHAINGLQ